MHDRYFQKLFSYQLYPVKTTLQTFRVGRHLSLKCIVGNTATGVISVPLEQLVSKSNILKLGSV
jgi:hypothetical protein